MAQMRYLLRRFNAVRRKKMQTQTQISSDLTGSPGGGSRTLIHGPLSKLTWSDARTLIILGTLTLLVKSDQAATVLNYLSGPAGFKPKMVPILLSTILLYFLLVFLVHTVTDLMIWWPAWRELQTANKTSRLLAAFVAVRFALEYGVPLVFAIFAVR
jgi:hypothetical protein